MKNSAAREGGHPTIELTGAEVHCSGAWTLSALSRLDRQLRSMQWPKTGLLVFDMGGVTAMDTAGAWLFQRTLFHLEQGGCPVKVVGLGEEARSIVDLVRDRSPAPGLLAESGSPGFLEITGRRAWRHVEEGLDFLFFLGETATALLRSLARPARIRWQFVGFNIQTAGFDALVIVGLLSFLLGVVIAYQGGVQLRYYGANIFVADLVGLSMVREFAPLMTAIILAGRTGSAYTAEIGTMQVTEEIDALRSIGVAPMDLLVVPKLLGLFLVMPLLTVYADMVGIAGGVVMAGAMLGVSAITFLDRLEYAVDLTSYLIGLGKAPVFAGIIATVGCFQGFRAYGGAERVSRHTTISVVQSVFLIIVVDAAFSVTFSWLGI